MPEEQQIRIKHGFQDHAVPWGLTVEGYRQQFGPMLRIPAGAVGYSGNVQLDDKFRPEPDTVLEFARKSGEKGSISPGQRKKVF